MHGPVVWSAQVHSAAVACIHLAGGSSSTSQRGLRDDSVGCSGEILQPRLFNVLFGQQGVLQHLGFLQLGLIDTGDFPMSRLSAIFLQQVEPRSELALQVLPLALLNQETS